MSETSEKYKTSYYLSKKDDRSTIVFIHGVGLTKEIWDQQIEFFKNHNTLTYDLLGHGKTPLEKAQLSFEDYTKQLLNLIDELDLKKIHLVGFSLGSLIARHFASVHGDRLSSLILHGSIYKRTKEQKTVVKNRYEILKLDGPASRKSSLRRWFTLEFAKKNTEIHEKIYSILENNNINKKVQLIGYKKNPFPYIIRSDILILSSKFEGLPNILLETQYLKKYIISSNCSSGPKEILMNGKAGDLFKVNDYKGLARKINTYCKNKNKFKKKILVGFNNLHRFNHGKNCKKYYEILNSFF